METLPKGFHYLEPGDNVEDPGGSGVWGAVFDTGEGAVIIWDDGEPPTNAEDFRTYALVADYPYRIQR